jgi:hypothetical protein
MWLFAWMFGCSGSLEGCLEEDAASVEHRVLWEGDAPEQAESVEVFTDADAWTSLFSDPSAAPAIDFTAEVVVSVSTTGCALALDNWRVGKGEDAVMLEVNLSSPPADCSRTCDNPASVGVAVAMPVSVGSVGGCLVTDDACSE